MGFPCNKGSKANRYSVTLPLKSQRGGSTLPDYDYSWTEVWKNIKFEVKNKKSFISDNIWYII